MPTPTAPAPIAARPAMSPPVKGSESPELFVETGSVVVVFSTEVGDTTVRPPPRRRVRVCRCRHQKEHCAARHPQCRARTAPPRVLTPHVVASALGASARCLLLPARQPDWAPASRPDLAR